MSKTSQPHPKPDRQYDKTHLSIDIAEKRGLIHRDYLAHCHRWSHVVKYVQRSGFYKKAVVLDVGCGREFPLAKTMYVNRMPPKYYLGVDMNKLEKPQMLENASNSKWFHFLGQADASKLSATHLGKMVLDSQSSGKECEFPRPNVVTSFEMIEHVHPRLCRKILEVIYQVMTNDGVAFVSTPCFNGSAAGNHINEMTYQALGALIEDLGFRIEAHYGTFASISDYLLQLEKDSKTEESEVPTCLTAFDTFQMLREYYDSNVLATIFAPLYPQLSRNCLWRLRKDRTPTTPRLFPPLIEVQRPWGQHKDVLELNRPKRSRKK